MILKYRVIRFLFAKVATAPSNVLYQRLKDKEASLSAVARRENFEFNIKKQNLIFSKMIRCARFLFVRI